MHYGNVDGSIFNIRGTIYVGVGVGVHEPLPLSSLAETASSFRI